ncbi:MAG: delta-60 repeat domain-containing protein, partial [Chthoniobacterales bacterium]
LMGGGFISLQPSMGPQLALRRIARLKPDGTPELSFNPNVPNTNDYVYSIAVQQDGKILAGGSFNTLEPNFGPAATRNNIARLEIDGRLDRTLDVSLAGALEDVFATAIQPDGRILIGGGFNTVFGMPRNHIARLNTDGTLDIAFNPNPNGPVFSIAVQADDQILVGGDFSTFDPTDGVDEPVTRNSIARLNPNGTLDLPFNPNANRVVFSIAVQADGQILVGGGFNTLEPPDVAGQPVIRNYIARLNPNGTLDLALDPPFNPNANGVVHSIVVQGDDQILVGGEFTTLEPTNGVNLPVPRNHIARLNPNGMAENPFNPNADREIEAIAVQADGQILIGGEFFVLGPTNPDDSPVWRNRIARLNRDGMVDLPFNPNANHSVVSIAVQADGQILACGGFTTLEPTNGMDLPRSRNYIARLKPDGTLDLDHPFDPNASNPVLSIAVQTDGKILTGGSFAVIGGQTRSIFARLSNDTAALQNLDVTRSDTQRNTITWTRGGSSPELTRATFELSTNGGAAYTFLGHGVRVGTTSNFTLTGLILPAAQNFWIRARGYYRSGQFNGSESITESVRNAIIPRTSIVIGDDIKNFSTRFRVQTGDNVGIGGFIVAGTEPKHVLIRAIGPSLAQFGVPNALADPVLELHGPDTFVTMTNNNWRDRQEAGILASGIPPTNDLESAIDATLDPGAYTALVSGNGNTSGVALVEVYDLDQEVDSKLANISTRAFVGTGDDVVIAGFILGDGNGDNHGIVVRGIGPSLTAFGVPNALANPMLELRDSNGTLLVANNDWQDDPAQAAELTAAGLAPTNNLESGIAATLSPGPYTALLRGLNNGTGVGLVEVYDRGAL